MTDKTFKLSMKLDVSLDVGSIWPDGDAPENPTAQQVVNRIRESAGHRDILETLSAWNLADHALVSVENEQDCEDQAIVWYW